MCRPRRPSLTLAPALISHSYIGVSSPTMTKVSVVLSRGILHPLDLSLSLPSAFFSDREPRRELPKSIALPGGQWNRGNRGRSGDRAAGVCVCVWCLRRTFRGLGGVLALARERACACASAGCMSGGGTTHGKHHGKRTVEEDLDDVEKVIEQAGCSRTYYALEVSVAVLPPFPCVDRSIDRVSRV